MLRTAGFTTVYSMEGGIKAWEGFTATGTPEMGMSFFAPAATPHECIALAWLLEEGSRTFYAALAAELKEKDAAHLFNALSMAEEHHKASLISLFRDLSGEEPGPEFPRGIIMPDEARMEGAIKVKEALAWSRNKDARNLIELSMALETNSYDLYIKMSRQASDDRAVKIFDVLVMEEREHLARLAAAMDKIV